MRAEIFFRNDHALVNPKIRDGIMAIFQVFEPPDLLEKESAPDRDDEVSTKFLMLSALDTIGLIQTLYPDRTSNLEAHEPGSAAIVSDRPSTAGSSTLIAGSSDVGSAEASSTAPSSIEASDKPVNDESSATAAHAEEQESGFPLKGELKNTPAKTTKVVKQDLAPQLQHTCGRLRHLLAREETSTQKKAWTMLYYSEDGSALSMGPKSTTNGQQSLSIKHSHEPSRRRNESDKDHRAIKAAVTDLLNEDSKRSSATLDHFQRSRQEEHSADPVERLIYEAMGKAQFNLEFGAAHSWWRTLGIYRDFLGSNPAWYLQNLLQEISEDLRRAVEVATKVSKDCDVQCRSLVRLQYHHNIVLTQMEEQRKALRIKTWYVSEVRHSATYEEALLVTRVLRTMASSKSTKQPGGLSNWARQRLRGSGIHDRSEAQTIEALAAPKEHGGLSKLADEQVELTSRWLTRKSIENFCKGEERIHRFCYEIQRSVGKIAGPSLLESPVLWSSYLFKSERISFGTRPRPGTIGPPCGTTLTPPSPFGYSFLQAPVLASPGAPPKGLGLSKAKSPMNHYGGFWTTSQASRAPTGVTSQPLLPPTPTSPPTAWSSNVFTSDSPLHTFAPPQLPVSGFGRHSAHSSNEGETSPEKKAFAQQIKKNLCSLLLSDLGYHLWNQGSETDAWINEHIADEKSIGMQGDIEAAQGIPEPSPPLAKRLGYPINPPTEVPRQNEPWKNPSTSASESSVPPPDPAHGHERPTNAFPFLEAYTSLLWSFSLTHDPYAKLYALYELEDLIIKSLYATFTSRYAQDAVNPSVNRRQSHPGDAGVRSKSVPRTKATSLEEIIANCTERRAGTLRFQASKPSFILSGFASEIWTEDAPSTDDIVNELLCIFRSSNLRPTTLFRDLQYIAAFVPSEILDQTPQGKAFWDVALAALALKDDLCDTIITRAHGITAYHIPSAKPSDPSMDNALASTTLRDAANLWLITAKEGSPIAARELGLFYLTHPELLPRITMPFSKAKDVFKSVMSTDYRTGDKERGALDPYTFAVVRHWMEIAANGGDKDARDFLRGSGDVDVGR